MYTTYFSIHTHICKSIIQKIKTNTSRQARPARPGPVRRVVAANQLGASRCCISASRHITLIDDPPQAAAGPGRLGSRRHVKEGRTFYPRKFTLGSSTLFYVSPFHALFRFQFQQLGLEFSEHIIL